MNAMAEQRELVLPPARERDYSQYISTGTPLISPSNNTDGHTAVWAQPSYGSASVNSAPNSPGPKGRVATSSAQQDAVRGSRRPVLVLSASSTPQWRRVQRRRLLLNPRVFRYQGWRWRY